MIMTKGEGEEFRVHFIEIPMRISIFLPLCPCAPTVLNSNDEKAEKLSDGKGGKMSLKPSD